MATVNSIRIFTLALLQTAKPININQSDRSRFQFDRRARRPFLQNINFYLIETLFIFAALKLPMQNRLKVFEKVIKMINQKFLESAVLLSLVNHKVVAWTFIKLCGVYKYVGLFV